MFQEFAGKLYDQHKDLAHGLFFARHVHLLVILIRD